MSVCVCVCERERELVVNTHISEAGKYFVGLSPGLVLPGILIDQLVSHCEHSVQFSSQLVDLLLHLCVCVAH